MPGEDTQFRKLTAIMFTDVVGYSALSQEDEALALLLLDEHQNLLRSIFPKHHGREIKTTGDGFLVEFASALAAVECALEIQEVLAVRNASEPAARKLSIRIGVHVGDIVCKEGDIFGDGVNIASRLEGLADPGGICVSEDVARHIQNKTDWLMVRLGRNELKNIHEPVVVYKLLPPAAGPKARRLLKRQRWWPRANRWVASAGVALLAFGAVGLGFWLVLHSGDWRLKADAGSIAVLPFVNISGAASDEGLSDGLTVELINALSRVERDRTGSKNLSLGDRKTGRLKVNARKSRSESFPGIFKFETRFRNHPRGREVHSCFMAKGGSLLRKNQQAKQLTQKVLRTIDVTRQGRARRSARKSDRT